MSKKAELQSLVVQITRNLLQSDDGYEDIHETIKDWVEKPMIETVMKFTNDNQSQAAKHLGINRATLRTKLTSP